MQLFGLNMFDPKSYQYMILDTYSSSIFRPSASFCEALFDALSAVSSLLISSSKSQVTCPLVGRNNTNGATMKSVQIWAFALLDSTQCLKVQLLSCCGVCGAAKAHFCFDDAATKGTCLLLLVHFNMSLTVRMTLLIISMEQVWLASKASIGHLQAMMSVTTLQTSWGDLLVVCSWVRDIL